MLLEDFHNIHAGGTMLLVGNGENLRLTPPARFRYPSIGMNTIHKYDNWTPTYYTTVDNRVWREFGDEIERRFSGIPKFIPTPNLDIWQGLNFYRWLHRPGEIMADRSPSALSNGLAFQNIMHVALQLAYWMGAANILMIGVHHQPNNNKAHFWGRDDGIPNPAPLDLWLKEYKKLSDSMQENGVTILNISENTHVPDSVLKRDDWRKYANQNA
jgi:hypothetical protein